MVEYGTGYTGFDVKSFGPLAVVLVELWLNVSPKQRTYIVNTGPYISEGPLSLRAGEYVERNELLPSAGELCREPCDRSGDGVRVFVYSGRVLGSKSGETFCDPR